MSKKIYLHYNPNRDDKEEEWKTIILTISQPITINKILSDFESKLFLKFPNILLNKNDLGLKNTRGVVISDGGDLFKRINTGEDIYVFRKTNNQDSQSKVELSNTQSSDQAISGNKFNGGVDDKRRGYNKLPLDVFARLGFMPLEDPPFPESFEASCPICGEFITYSISDKTVTCNTCKTISVPVTFVDTQTNCSNCNKLIFRTKGKKVIVCDTCGYRCASLHCADCKVPFVFPDGIAQVPCVSCNKVWSATEATSNSASPIGLLINKEVNEPKDWENEFEQKKTFKYKINLITQWFQSSFPERQLEIDYTLRKNLECKHIDKIHLLLEDIRQLPNQFKNIPKIMIKGIGHRWKFKDALSYCNEYLKGELCIVANADIYFDQSLNYLQRYPTEGKVICLTRHDELGNMTYIFNEWTAPVCQDSWIFISPLQENFESDFYFGWMGVDNRIAYELKQNTKYHVINPALRIISRHVHATNKRTYTEENKVPGGYSTVIPNFDT